MPVPGWQGSATPSAARTAGREVLRRIRPINDDRRRRLAALPDDCPLCTDRLHALALAFTEPMMARRRRPGWRRYFRFVAQLANSAHPVAAG